MTTKTKTTQNETPDLSWLTEEPVSDTERAVAKSKAERAAREAADPHAIEALERAIAALETTMEDRRRLKARLVHPDGMGEVYHAQALKDVCADLADMVTTSNTLHAMLRDARSEEALAAWGDDYCDDPLMNHHDVAVVLY